MSPNEPIQRRSFIRLFGLVGAAIAVEGATGVSRRILAQRPAGPDDPEVPNEIVQKIIDQRFGGRTIQRGHVTLDMAPMSEDGRYVPVAIESDLPMTADKYVKTVFLIVDHNPDPLVTAFHLTPALGPVQIQTRIKMKRTSWIRAIAETNTGELYADYLKVETSLNGCG